MSLWYCQFEPFTLQPAVTCLCMANASQSKAILEVGCGSGSHSEFIAKNYLQKGSLLVSSDFSKDMVTMMQSRYETSEFK